MAISGWAVVTLSCSLSSPPFWGEGDQESVTTTSAALPHMAILYLMQDSVWLPPSKHVARGGKQAEACIVHRMSIISSSWSEWAKRRRIGVVPPGGGCLKLQAHPCDYSPDSWAVQSKWAKPTFTNLHGLARILICGLVCAHPYSRQ